MEISMRPATPNPAFICRFRHCEDESASDFGVLDRISKIFDLRDYEAFNENAGRDRGHQRFIEHHFCPHPMHERMSDYRKRNKRRSVNPIMYSDDFYEMDH